MKTINTRRSIRKYTDAPVSEKLLRRLLSEAERTQTMGNLQLYSVVVTRSDDQKRRLAPAHFNQPMAEEAPVVLTFCADYRRWYDVFCQYVDDVRKPDMGDLFLAEADALIAAQNAVAAAHSLGLGSCYIGDITENYEYHKKLLNLPQYVVPAAMVCFGYPTGQQLRRPKPPRHPVEALVHENGYDPEKSGRMTQMLGSQEGKSGEELADYIRRFCQRKWNSDFSVEMSRSCAEMVRDWCER